MFFKIPVINSIMNQRLILNSGSYFFNASGSTCVTVFYTPQKLVCANVGDSRAIVGRSVNGGWTTHELSIDQKPCDPNEKKRILECGGRVEPMKGITYLKN